MFQAGWQPVFLTTSQFYNLQYFGATAIKVHSCKNVTGKGVFLQFVHKQPWDMTADCQWEEGERSKEKETQASTRVITQGLTCEGTCTVSTLDKGYLICNNRLTSAQSGWKCLIVTEPPPIVFNVLITFMHYFCSFYIPENFFEATEVSKVHIAIASVITSNSVVIIFLLNI